MVCIEAADLERTAAGLFEAWGVPRPAALVTARHLVESSLAGVDSHGVVRLPQYLDLIDAREIDPVAVPTIVEDRGAIVTVEAHHALGPVAGEIAADLAAERATTHGIALVAARHAGHAGRIGAYVERMAGRGIVAVAFCNSPVYGHFVAPPGARTGRLATNPIAYAVPTSDGLMVADFATSSLPEGAVRLLRDRGRGAPPDMLLDAQGAPTTDPKALYAEPPGVILPLGGAANGHKGFALAILVEVLAGTLAGDAVEDPALRGNNLTLIGIEARATPAGAAFPDLVAELVAYIRAAAPVLADGRVMVPGDKERSAREQRSRDGIPLDGFTRRAIIERAARVGYRLPAPFHEVDDE